MNEQNETLTRSEIAMYVVGGVSGAALGVLAAVFLGSVAGSGPASGSPFFWFASRASAIVAYLLLWFSTAWGITISSKGLGGRISGPVAYAMHNVTSWLALGFGTVHGLSLLGDKVVPFSLPGILVPFLAGYKPFLTGLGTISLYLGVIVTGAFYLKKRLGYKAWRTIHGASYGMFGMVTFHSIALGTDTSTFVMKAIYVLAAGSVVLLTIFRIATAKGSKKPAARAGRVEAPKTAGLQTAAPQTAAPQTAAPQTAAAKAAGTRIGALPGKAEAPQTTGARMGLEATGTGASARQPRG